MSWVCSFQEQIDTFLPGTLVCVIEFYGKPICLMCHLEVTEGYGVDFAIPFCHQRKPATSPCKNRFSSGEEAEHYICLQLLLYSSGLRGSLLQPASKIPGYLAKLRLHQHATKWGYFKMEASSCLGTVLLSMSSLHAYFLHQAESGCLSWMVILDPKCYRLILNN